MTCLGGEHVARQRRKIGGSALRYKARIPSAALACAVPTLVLASSVSQKDLIGYTVETQSNYRATFNGQKWTVSQDRSNTYSISFIDPEQASVRLSIAIHQVGGGSDTTENRSGVLKIGKVQGTAATRATILTFESGVLLLTNEWEQGANQLRIVVQRNSDGFRCSAKETIGHTSNNSIEVVDPSTGQLAALRATPARISYCRVFK
jgi:hypothetical protein